MAKLPAGRKRAPARKPKKQRKEHPVLRKVFTVIFVLAAIAVVCASVAGLYVYRFAKNYVEGEQKIDLDEYKANQEQTSIIYAYDANGKTIELLRLHGAENRVWIDYDDIPDTLVDAFRDLEDKRFEEHNGVDWVRTIGGVTKSGFSQGGSTITQQLIKNLTGENGRYLSRKFYEILNALNLERYNSKQTIMEFYLNTVYLGNGCYGVRTAAEKYFGKNVGDLNAAECAVIASITQFPSDYNPLVDPESVTERKELCLHYMREQGDLNQQEYEDALAYKLIYTNSEGYKGSQVTDTDEEDDNEYTEQDIKYTSKIGSGESSYYVEYVIDKVIADLQEQYDMTYNEAWRKVFFGGLRIYSAMDMDVQDQAETVYVNRETFPEEEDTKENPAVQSSITIMDYSGRVVAMVGGAGEKKTFRGLNRATDSPRQPGSSIKPLSVYAPCIENDICTFSTKVQNYGIMTSEGRWPYNFGHVAGSPSNFVTVQYAVAQSLNTVPVQLVQQIGLQPCFDFLVDDLKFKYLVTDEDDPAYDCNLSSICVGGMSHGVTTLEMTAAYAIFGNNGLYFDPYCYYKVTNNDGSDVLLEAGDEAGTRVLSESSAGVMRELLHTVVTQGTGGAYAISGFECFAKTGTTSDDYDRWFVGGTPYYVAAVWYGYDKPTSITNTWGNPAGKIFHAIMEPIHENYDSLSFPEAEGVVARRYCTGTGDLASKGCSSTSLGYYKVSNLPYTCNNAMIHAIGAEIPASAMKPQTTKESTTKKKADDKKTTKAAAKTTAAPVTEAPATTAPPPATEAPITTLPPETEPATVAPPTSPPETEAPQEGD